LLLTCYTPVTRRVIEAVAKLRGIVKYGVGIDAIDIAAANRRGIAVVNVPEYAEETEAEGAFALLLALAKRIKPIQHAMDAIGLDQAGSGVDRQRPRRQDARPGRGRENRFERRAHGAGISHAAGSRV